jgi:hypothetical protein
MQERRRPGRLRPAEEVTRTTGGVPQDSTPVDRDAPVSAPSGAQVERARSLRRQIAEITRDEKVPAEKEQRQPESARDFVHRRMRETSRPK